MCDGAASEDVTVKGVHIPTIQIRVIGEDLKECGVPRSAIDASHAEAMSSGMAGDIDFLQCGSGFIVVSHHGLKLFVSVAAQQEQRQRADDKAPHGVIERLIVGTGAAVDGAESGGPETGT